MENIRELVREKFKDLFENSLNYIIVYGLNGKVLDANNIILSTFGYNNDEIVNKPFRDFIYPEDLIQAAKALKELRKTGKISSVNTYRIKIKQGGFRYVEIHGTPIRKDNKILAILAIGHDVTEKREAQLKLKESEEKYRHLYNNSPFSIVLFDLKGTIIDFNSTLENFLGYERDTFIGKDFLEIGLFKPEMVPILKKRLILYVSGETLDTIELQIYKKNGTIAWVNPSVTLTHIGGETVILIMFQDITSRKKAEEKLKESEENYRKAYERENFYKDLFTHDASNILQSMLMSLEMCEFKVNNLNISDDIKNSINLFKDQIKRGADLVKNVKKFSELYESDGLLKNLRVKAVLEDAEKIVRNISNYKKIDIKYDNLKEDYLIQADDFLINVFENILINAAKHNDNQFTEIFVKFSEIQENGKKLLKMEFIDNGRGIPDFKKESIFNRGDIKDRSVSGLGLGLWLVKSITDRYNAKIWVENKIRDDYTQGSNFVIIFPLVN